MGQEMGQGIRWVQKGSDLVMCNCKVGSSGGRIRFLGPHRAYA